MVGKVYAVGKGYVVEEVVVEERYAVRKENVAGKNTWFNDGCRRDTRYNEKYIEHKLEMRGFESWHQGSSSEARW